MCSPADGLWRPFWSVSSGILPVVPDDVPSACGVTEPDAPASVVVAQALPRPDQAGGHLAR
jgi:hypothetical protein